MTVRKVVTYREFCNPDLCGRTIAGYTIPPIEHFPSMRESITDWDESEKSAVLDYMRRDDFFAAASTSSYKTDVFTGEQIPYSGDVYEDDAGFEWPDYLVYYIDVYDVALPDDFVRHVLESTR